MKTTRKEVSRTGKRGNPPSGEIVCRKASPNDNGRNSLLAYGTLDRWNCTFPPPSESSSSIFGIFHENVYLRRWAEWIPRYGLIWIVISNHSLKPRRIAASSGCWNCFSRRKLMAYVNPQRSHSSLVNRRHCSFLKQSLRLFARSWLRSMPTTTPHRYNWIMVHPRREMPIQFAFSNLHKYSSLYSCRHIIWMIKSMSVDSTSADNTYCQENLSTSH